MAHTHTNALINSSSPYLLQHAHNPVDWQPWSDDMIKNNNKSGKLLLISIGYAACHWCHVMEKESFEDEDVARVMNEHFVCVKVDREERPDVDNYFMTAIHLMGLQGGWPLNIVALPDGKPVWGGTYFPKKAWKENLKALAQFYKENKDKTLEYALNLQEGIEQTLIPVMLQESSSFNNNEIEIAVGKWKEKFDFENGGRKGHPKFPMPVNLDFLLYYGFMKSDTQVLDYINLTLQKMAYGGIYDQIGGGFARYATDEHWKIPHFEKMLYDNGQLLGTYSRGYQLFKLDEFKTLVYETVGFIERELMSPEYGFYSSLDADSEGEEGKYYVWSKNELQALINNDFELFAAYFNINSKGYWGNDNYILLREMSEEDFAGRHGLSPDIFKRQVEDWKKTLLNHRLKRIPPALDHKVLASWNAIVINGLTEAYKAFGDNRFKMLALKNAGFIKDNMIAPEGKLYHSWIKGKPYVDGFLDDYALVIQAYLSIYEITGSIHWLNSASEMMEYTFRHFYDISSGLFFYSSNTPGPALTNFFQTEDNVVPAANSVMINNIHRLYLLYAEPEFLEQAEKMIQSITGHFLKYPHAFANWGTFLLKLSEPYCEVVVCGENAKNIIMELQSQYRPNVLWAVATEPNEVPLLKGRYKENKTLIYVCRNGACRLPVENIREALTQFV